MKILVTGGAGYIGSHIIKELKANSSNQIHSVDNLSTGNEYALQGITNYAFDLQNYAHLDNLIQQNQYDVIIHTASAALVAESVATPLYYYNNNIVGGLNLISAAIKHQVPYFIFSSSAAVYGEPEIMPIPEELAGNPINPYGRTKWYLEQVLADIHYAYPNFKYAALRYFNVAGADPSLEIGQGDKTTSHLIKIAAQAAIGKRPYLTIYGTDYPTRDGTCERDYVHVSDLSRAHVNSIDFLQFNSNGIFNVSYERGYTVKEVVDTFQTIEPFDVKYGGRRAGDPASLVGKADKIKNTTMNWQPKFNDLERICRTAYEWEKKLK